MTSPVIQAVSSGIWSGIPPRGSWLEVIVTMRPPWVWAAVRCRSRTKVWASRTVERVFPPPAGVEHVGVDGAFGEEGQISGERLRAVGVGAPGVFGVLGSMVEAGVGAGDECGGAGEREWIVAGVIRMSPWGGCSGGFRLAPVGSGAEGGGVVADGGAVAGLEHLELGGDTGAEVGDVADDGDAAVVFAEGVENVEDLVE